MEGVDVIGDVTVIAVALVLDHLDELGGARGVNGVMRMCTSTELGILYCLCPESEMLQLY